MLIPAPRPQLPSEFKPAMVIQPGAPPKVAEFLANFIALIGIEPSRAGALLRLNHNLLGKDELVALCDLVMDTPDEEDYAAMMYRRFGTYVVGDYGKWVMFDTATTELISEAAENFEPDYAETWKLEAYLGRLASWHDDFGPSSW